MQFSGKLSLLNLQHCTTLQTLKFMGQLRAFPVTRYWSVSALCRTTRCTRLNLATRLMAETVEERNESFPDNSAHRRRPMLYCIGLSVGFACGLKTTAWAYVFELCGRALVDCYIMSDVMLVCACACIAATALEACVALSFTVTENITLKFCKLMHDVCA